MDIKELRIGNWACEPDCDDAKPFKVFSIYHEAGNNKINGIRAALIQPIPLTEEWMNKLGLEKSVHGEHWKLNLIGWFTKYTENEGWYSYHVSRYKVVEFKYVHQLQNLYFALTGEELTVKELSHEQ